MNEMLDPGEENDLPDGLARVVRSPTLISHLTEQCRKARKSGGSAFPPAVGWITLDEAANHRDDIGFSGLEKLVHAAHERARVQLAGGDVTARFGLDAIGVLLDSEGGDRDFEADASALHKAINGSLFEIGEHTIAATVTVCIRPVREALRPAEMNLVRAARAAEQLSAAGGNRFEVGAGDAEEADTPGTLLGQLTKALRDNSLKVVFQPLLATSGPEVERIQLLPRLKGSDGTLIPAARFIPVAAERGVLPAVDHWMIAHAIRLLQKRADSGAELPTLFLNQSPALVDDEKFARWLSEQVETLDRGQRKIVLEFNIRELKPRIRDARTVLAGLQKLGIGISLTGIDERVPEVVLLKHLPADYLRMKADFAHRLLDNAELTERFEAFARAARAAGRKLIVPMLEDAEEVSRIWQMEVDLIQGNFIQQPSEEPIEA
ncbi:MAG: EAL domain-containing protein [Wenzhouxiangellaceae bacterium]|nr:EAL domain-containing protein [Wenzhouxiangellaceae bacterium]MBS3747503.1 EAL domain-containing protein [Wenzhouxiangellaceae bacterium]MBS3823618.1 EAL domain-containing protein [Wenzhouxiangellaceae bacterium]